MASTRSMASQVQKLIRSNKIHDNTSAKVFTIALNSTNAEVWYEKKGDVYDLTHTNIPEQFQGQGLGHILAERVFDHLVQNRKKFKLTCEFLQHFSSKNPQKYAGFIVE